LSVFAEWYLLFLVPRKIVSGPYPFAWSVAKFNF